jgi:hypothetical protein
MTPNLRSTTELKAHVERTYPPDHPGRAAVLALPDDIGVEEFRATLPLLLRLLRMKPAEERPP